MNKVQPMLASENTAARLLDMKPREFRELVELGHLPKGNEIAPGVHRWDTELLKRLAQGEAIDGWGEISW